MGDNTKTSMADSSSKQLARMAKQIMDTVAPGMNPRRTKNRSDIVAAEPDLPSPADRQTTDRHNDY